MLIEACVKACIKESSCGKWFQVFKNGSREDESKEHNGRPKLFENELLKSNEIIAGESYQLQLVRLAEH